MKKIFTTSFFGIISLLTSTVFSQTTVTWNFGTASGTASPTSGTPVSNLTISDMTIGNSFGAVATPISTTSASSGYTGSTGSYNIGNAAKVGSLVTGAGGSAYFEFTLTPTAGYSVSLSALNFGTRSTSTGPQAYTIRTSLDAFATDAITPGTIANNSTWSLKTNTTTIASTVGAPVTIRIYGYNGAGSASSGTINWRLDDVAITVNVTSGTDVTPPTVSSLSPANNATNVSINTSLQIVFNENVKKGTGNIVIKKLSDNSIVQTIDVTTTAVTITNATATVTINTLASSTGYYVEIDNGAIQDIAGNNFAGITGSSTWSFTTAAPDTTPPVISSLSPANNSSNVSISTPLQIIFNENIKKGTGNIRVKKVSDNSIVQTIDVTTSAVTITNATATISINQLAYSTSYYIEVDAGAFQDIAGNNFAGITGNSTWAFATGAVPTAGIIGKNYDFNNCSSYLIDGFRQYSVLGAQVWSCTAFGRTYSGTGASSDSAIQMDGFATTYVPNEDWFISPPFNLTGTNSPTLKFYSRTKFAGSSLVLKVSTNYSGSGDPNLATWTNLNGRFPAINSDIWTLSDSIDLSPYSVPNVYLAWVYTSSSTAAPRTTLDDIRVYVGCTPSSNQPTTLNLTPSITSISGTFTAAAAGTIPSDGYLVVMSTSSTLSAQPSNGTAYAIDDVIGNGTVVSINNSTNFTASNLNPSTQYYFFIYSYSANQTCYNLTNPLKGNIFTSSPPVCTPPTVQASNLTAGSITGSSITLNYVRGNGDNILIVARANASVNQNPINGVSYPAGTQIGTSNFVIYNGPASSFNYTGLPQNTTYYFALYEYGNTNNCYNTSPPLTDNFTTSCITPVNVSSFNGVAANASVNLTWTNPTASCFNEILVIASNAPITGQGTDFTGPASTTYSGPNQVVYRSTGSNVTVTGLTNGTTYYFKIFTKNGGTYSSGVQISVSPYDPASGFQYLYGNLHSHSSYSDGNKENTSRKPIDDYTYGRDANCMDFLGISEHNHSGAGMNIANFPLGYNDANTINGVTSPTTGNSIITLWGMEWGVISGGGHVVVYGFDNQLIGWEPGNYNIFCAKNDYTSLFNLVNGQPGAFATLAHPNFTDYTNLAGTPYSASADNAIVGTAIESGPAFSTDTTYSNFPSQLAYLDYYRTLLAKGYHLGAQMDGDNHYFTFGRQSANRMVVLSVSKTRADLISAIKEMRFYASNDCNVRVDYKCYTNPMGKSVVHAGVPTLTINVTDPDAETVDSIYIWGGKIGDTVSLTPIKVYTGTSSITFDASDPANLQPDNTTYYYYAIIRQPDGNRVITSPIWYTRSDAVLPITLSNFKATYLSNKTSLLQWTTEQELNSKVFIIERSIDGGRTFVNIGSVNAKGSSTTTSQYQFTDLSPVVGTNLYRLKEIDIDDHYQYSNVVSVVVTSKEINFYSLYPNPAHQFTYLNATGSISKEITIEIVDATGRIFKTQTNHIDNNHPVKLDVSTLNKGMYFIKVMSDGNINTERIVIK